MIRRYKRGREIPSSSAARDLFPRALESALDRLLLDFDENLVERLEGELRRRRQIRPGEVAANRRGQVLYGDQELAALAPQVRMIDDSRQLGQVSWPVVLDQSRKRFGREPGALRGAASIGALEEVLRQEGQVVEPLSQRAQANDEHRERIVKVGPDSLACQRDLGFGDGRADQPDRGIERESQPGLQIAREREDLADQERRAFAQRQPRFSLRRRVRFIVRFRSRDFQVSE